MQTINDNIYNFPKYYDLVFGSDWRAEVRFLEGCLGKHLNRPAVRLFEPACGTGRLVYRLAKAGYEVSGLDLNPKAIEFCNRRLARAGLPASTFVGDMTDFRLPRKVDAAFNTINSFRHLASESQARDHLTCVAGALRKGGIYLLGLHLTPSVGEATEEEGWSARRGHLQVNTYMWLVERNLRRRSERYGMRFDIHTPTRSFRIQDEFAFRTYTAPQVQRLIRTIPELRIDSVYDFTYDVSRPIELGPSTEDVVLVLKRA